MIVQLKLGIPCRYESSDCDDSYYNRLKTLLSQNLDFHTDSNKGCSSHNFHSFPAKFPPQLPRLFIENLTRTGDIFLDPMMGSGTAVLEGFLLNRHSIGMDIDPLAILISKVKTSPYHFSKILIQMRDVIETAKTMVRDNQASLKQILDGDFDSSSRKFFDYWFSENTQIELLSLIESINVIPEPDIRAFFQLAFSSIIITKSGGVSLALDLGHTRPHRAKMIVLPDGNKMILDSESGHGLEKLKNLTKNMRSVFADFEKRVLQNLKGIIRFGPSIRSTANILFANTQSIPLRDHSVDLIVTSPPYASNAIDYMRAHKFSLAWMGYSIDQLGKKRKEYIGSDGVSKFQFEPVPLKTNQIINEIKSLDDKKGQVLHRYFSEMSRTLSEMFRVLKPGKAAVVVVGNSIMRGRSTETAECLADIGKALGFMVPAIGIRNLDRNRRMMPAGNKIDNDSQIQQRMHQEYVIGFCKPEATSKIIYGNTKTASNPS